MILAAKEKRQGKHPCLFWQREKDSNPHIQSQSLLCYPYTIPLSRRRFTAQVLLYAKGRRLSIPNLHIFLAGPGITRRIQPGDGGAAASAAAGQGRPSSNFCEEKVPRLPCFRRFSA